MLYLQVQSIYYCIFVLLFNKLYFWHKPLISSVIIHWIIGYFATLCWRTGELKIFFQVANFANIVNLRFGKF